VMYHQKYVLYKSGGSDETTLTREESWRSCVETEEGADEFLSPQTGPEWTNEDEIETFGANPAVFIHRIARAPVQCKLQRNKTCCFSTSCEMFLDGEHQSDIPVMTAIRTSTGVTLSSACDHVGRLEATGALGTAYTLHPMHGSGGESSCGCCGSKKINEEDRLMAPMIVSVRTFVNDRGTGIEEAKDLTVAYTDVFRSLAAALEVSPSMIIAVECGGLQLPKGFTWAEGGIEEEASLTVELDHVWVPVGAHAVSARWEYETEAESTTRTMHCVLLPSGTKVYDSVNGGWPETETDEALRFTFKVPVWDDNYGGFTLNFHGRASVASVKNFQMVREDDAENEVVLQFRKTGDDEFSMDYGPPLTPLQAFAICSSAVFTNT